MILRGMVKEFHCLQCGNCCKDNRITNSERIKPRFIRESLINVNDISLGLFDWEVKNFRKTTEDLEIQMLDVKIANLIYDLKNKVSIVTHYTYNRHPKCAFLNDKNKCLIYQNRPILCRMWPCPYGKFKPKTLRSSSKVCRAELPIDELHEELHMKKEYSSNIISDDVKRNLSIRYKENYYYRYIFDNLNELIMNFIDNQTKKDKIKPARIGYNLEFLFKKIKNSKKINFSDLFYDATGKTVQEYIRSSTNETDMLKLQNKI